MTYEEWEYEVKAALRRGDKETLIGLSYKAENKYSQKDPWEKILYVASCMINESLESILCDGLIACIRERNKMHYSKWESKVAHALEWGEADALYKLCDITITDAPHPYSKKDLDNDLLRIAADLLGMSNIEFVLHAVQALLSRNTTKGE